MMHRLWGQLRGHKALIGYLVLLGAAVLASQLHANSVRRDLERHDEISCQQRLVIAKNQVDVLDALITARVRYQLLDPGHIKLLRVDRDQLRHVVALGC